MGPEPKLHVNDQVHLVVWRCGHQVLKEDEGVRKTVLRQQHQLRFICVTYKQH